MKQKKMNTARKDRGMISITVKQKQAIISSTMIPVEKVQEIYFDYFKSIGYTL